MRDTIPPVYRQVLAVYGWSNIEVPPYCPKNDAERAAVSLFEDLVIDRLFALNAERAAEERGVSIDASDTSVATSMKPKATRRARKASNQTSLLGGEES